MYIRRQGKINYITGDEKALAANDLLCATWDAENSMNVMASQFRGGGDISSNLHVICCTSIV